jgi:hypothetical protein
LVDGPAAHQHAIAVNKKGSAKQSRLAENQPEELVVAEGLGFASKFLERR